MGVGWCRVDAMLGSESEKGGIMPLMGEIFSVTSTASVCKALTLAGLPCKATPMTASDYCCFHDPDKEASRIAARSAGGRARHGRVIGHTGEQAIEPVELVSVEDILVVLNQAITDVQRLENSLARARTLATVASVAIKAFEVSNTEKRLTELEEALERLKS